jgi:hypothetical protein
MERSMGLGVSTMTEASDVEGEGEAEALAAVFAEGEIPEVADDAGADDGGDVQLSASEQAYDTDAAEPHRELSMASARRRFRFSGEPLPVLKEILQGKLGGPKACLRAFLDMWQQATVRRGTGGARTFISPADGLAGIITGVILCIVDRYREVATPGQQRTLDRILSDHLKLLATPLSRDGRGGGHRVAGVKGKGQGIAGPALNHGNAVRLETVNQTAVVLLGLQRLDENPDLPPRAHARVRRLISELTGEFKRCLVKCYAGRDVHDWHYGLSSRLEDQGHLKTTWDMLVKLGRSKAASAEWYTAQAERIARLWPRVKGPWDGLSSAAGTLPHTG